VLRFVFVVFELEMVFGVLLGSMVLFYWCSVL